MTESCACGGVIVAPHESAIPFVVAQHNASLRHLKWRWVRELGASGEGSTAPFLVRDMSASRVRASTSHPRPRA